jgi:hypothetical protein
MNINATGFVENNTPLPVFIPQNQTLAHWPDFQIIIIVKNKRL